jgi:hypothetical protein
VCVQDVLPKDIKCFISAPLWLAEFWFSNYWPEMLQLPKSIDPLNITGLACPAFPLCPVAITEAERGAPDILQRICASLKKVSLTS